uniref:BTB domain-containing protein n=1 Tax=Strongyloides venezuelensis TaxID=75913 RepID=A0A0K0FL84_STRVS
MVSTNSNNRQSKRSENIIDDNSTKSFSSYDFGPSINSSCLTEVSITTTDYEQDELPIVSYNNNKRTFIINFKKQKILADEILKYSRDTNSKSFVILQLENNETIKVTPLLLSHASSLIERIILKKKDNACCINAKLFSPYHMKNIVNFLKTGHISFKVEDLTKLFAIIHRFEMSSICTLIESGILSCLKTHKSLLTTLLNFVSDSQNLASTKIKTNLLEMANYCLFHLITGQYFLDLSPSALIFLLSSDTLKISNEMDVMRMGVVFMDKVDCFGYADSIFNSIRFNHCNKEMLKNMKMELTNYGNKHLSYVFDCFNPDLNPSSGNNGKKSNEVIVRKNVNYLTRRDNKSKESNLISKSLKQIMDKLTYENLKEKIHFQKDNDISNINDTAKSSVKVPQKFNVMPCTPNILKKLRKSCKNKETKIPISTPQHTSVNSIDSNPYRRLTNYKNRLFSTDSIFDISRYHNAFEYNFNGDLYQRPITPHCRKEQLPKTSIEKNPYYYAFKDREQRKFSPESLYEIGCLTPKFTTNNKKSEVINSNEDTKKNFSLDKTQYSSKCTSANEPLSFTGKKFNIKLPKHNESNNQ